MALLQIIDKILGLKPVYWGVFVALTITATLLILAKVRIGVLVLERDAALGREASLQASLQLQNQAILQAKEQAKFRAMKLNEAENKAKLIAAERDQWKKEALSKPLTGTCDEMVGQLVESLK